jgi:hypothetical protein
MKTATRESVREHGRKLLAIFRHATDKDPVSLCRKLRHLESRGNNLAKRKCNDASTTYDQADKLAEDIVAKLDRLLGFAADKIPVFLNSDPRGYALKIACDYVKKHDLDIYRDWGGYGIIAPDLTPSA